MATPMAKSRGRFEKMAPPDCAMTWETEGGSQEKLALPTPSRIPATGSTETGSIMHLPIFWRRAKAFLNMAGQDSLGRLARARTSAADSAAKAFSERAWH